MASDEAHWRGNRGQSRNHTCKSTQPAAHPWPCAPCAPWPACSCRSPAPPRRPRPRCPLQGWGRWQGGMGSGAADLGWGGQGAFVQAMRNPGGTPSWRPARSLLPSPPTHGARTGLPGGGARRVRADLADVVVHLLEHGQGVVQRGARGVVGHKAWESGEGHRSGGGAEGAGVGQAGEIAEAGLLWCTVAGGLPASHPLHHRPLHPQPSHPLPAPRRPPALPGSAPAPR